MGRNLKLVARLDAVTRDIVFGWRVLWNDRVAMAAAALSLTLALGACSTAFSLIDALLLRPLPVRNAARLFYLEGPERGEDGFSYPLFNRFRQVAGRDLQLFGANWSVPLQPVVFDAANGERELVHIATISGNGFRVLGIRAAAGRLLDDFDEAHAATNPVAVISYSLWRRQFGGDRSVIGRHIISLGDRSIEIVGVVERSYSGLEPGYLADIWIPLSAMASPQVMASLDVRWIGVWGFAHSGDGASREALQAAFRNFRRDHAAELVNRNWSPAQTRSFLDARLEFHAAPNGADTLFRRMFRRPLWMFGILAALLLLIAASNVANLFAARGVARDREMALRMALGAGRWQLLRQLVIESGILASIGCAAAVGVSLIAGPFLAARLGSSAFPAWLDVRPDWRLMGFMAAAGFVTTVIFGVIPALRTSAVSPDEALKSGPRQSAAAAVLKPLVLVQVAFSFTALFLGGLFLVSFNKLVHVDPGFAKDHLILFTVNTKGLTPLQERAAVTQLRARLGDIAGVRSVGISQQAPIGGALSPIIEPQIRLPGTDLQSVRPTNLPTGPGFFRTMGIRLLAGREFDDRDLNQSTPPVPAIVNLAFAEHFFPGESPLQRRFEQIGDDGPIDQEIVGVAANSLYNNLREKVQPAIYSPLRSLNGATVEVRTGSDPRTLIGPLRHAIEATRPGLRVRTSILQSTRIADTLISERLLAFLGGFFGISAVLLAGVGLYGVINYRVTRRLKEIGIRMALGAQRSSILVLVMAEISALVFAGILVGALSGVAVARSAQALLFEVKPTDFWTLAAPLVCLAAASALAALRPAVRAVRTDPAAALRYE